MAYLINVHPPADARFEDRDVTLRENGGHTAALRRANHLAARFGRVIHVARGDGQIDYVLTTNPNIAKEEYLR